MSRSNSNQQTTRRTRASRRRTHAPRKPNSSRVDPHDEDHTPHEAAAMKTSGHKSDVVGSSSIFVPHQTTEAFSFQKDDFPVLSSPIFLNWQQKLLCPDWDRATGEIFLLVGN